MRIFREGLMTTTLNSLRAFFCVVGVFVATGCSSSERRTSVRAAGQQGRRRVQARRGKRPERTPAPMADATRALRAGGHRRSE